MIAGRILPEESSAFFCFFSCSPGVCLHTALLLNLGATYILPARIKQEDTFSHIKMHGFKFGGHIQHLNASHFTFTSKLFKCTLKAEGGSCHKGIMKEHFRKIFSTGRIKIHENQEQERNKAQPCQHTDLEPFDKCRVRRVTNPKTPNIISEKCDCITILRQPQVYSSCHPTRDGTI